MNVLIACEYSGIVRDAFIRKGHNAWSCDLLPTDQPGPHIQCDVLDVLDAGWDLMIAHPPCTFLCNSGVRWLGNDQSRWDQLTIAAEFFRKLLSAPIQSICIENPIMHSYGKLLIGRDQTQLIQPWMFGHTEQKATCLWLKNLPPLRPTNNVREAMLQLPANERERVHHMAPSEDRWKLRSTTYQGIADAFADQWG